MIFKDPLQLKQFYDWTEKKFFLNKASIFFPSMQLQ